MALIKSLFWLIFLPILCQATDLKPWFGNMYETELRATLLYQNYNSLATRYHCDAKREENSAFLTLSAAYPFKRYCSEFEATAAETSHQEPGWDNFRLTGRYQWLNESCGTPLSLVTGFILTEPLSRALHDISSFHHGHLEGELFVSFGKKYGYPCLNNYRFRWWQVIGAGQADVGYPWIRGDIAFEYRMKWGQEFRGFINTLWGTGPASLRPRHFKGYGPIKHRSIDAGIRYGYTFCRKGTLSIQYARRIYAHNFPRDANLVILEYYFPFGFQLPCNY